MRTMRAARDETSRDRRRPERLILPIAVALTVTMFGWQGYHLYWAHQSASHQRTTALVEAVDQAGSRQIDLVADLERAVLRSGYDGSDPGLIPWVGRYAAASAETETAVAVALPHVGKALTGPIGLVETTRMELDRRIDDVVRRLSSANEPMLTVMLDPAFSSARADFARAVDGQLAGLAAELDAGTAAERLNELHSVVVALVLFTTAIAAWAVFLRHLRRSQARLAREQEHRRQAEAASSQLQKTEALGLMADGVAHDVKHLTAIISGSADDVGLHLPAGSAASVALTRIEEATRQADELAQALLSFSRTSGVPESSVDLADVTTGMTRMLRYLVPSPIELVVDAPSVAWVRGDAPRLQQVVLNLVANARDAMPDGGRVTISIRPRPGDASDDARWLLVVEDTGHGMDAEVERHLFEPFFTTRPHGQGSGLGLTIVRQIVEDLGGTIGVTSHEGEGSTFTIELPAVPAPSVPAEPTESDGSLVVVAHPDEFVRDLIGGALVANGNRIVSASTTSELTSLLERQDPAIEVAVAAATLLPDAQLRAAVHDGIRVVLIGEGASEVDDDHAVRVLRGRLSLAVLTDSVAGLLRPCATGAAS